MRWTCALCGGECFEDRYGLCTWCLKEWTATGTHPLDSSIIVFAREHHAYEQKKLHKEIPFTLAFPKGEYDGTYKEVRYEIVEEKHRKIERRGRPRKLYGGKLEE